MSVRRISSAKIRAQRVLPVEDRDTLLPCPSCDGQKTRTVERPNGRYVMRICRWCEGLGSVGPPVFKLFSRWLKIKNHNRVMGRCQAKP